MVRLIKLFCVAAFCVAVFCVAFAYGVDSGLSDRGLGELFVEGSAINIADSEEKHVGLQKKLRPWKIITFY